MSLDNVISRIPKPILVAIVLVGAVFIIPLINPPVSVCSSQHEAFIKNQAGYLYPKKVTKGIRQPNYMRIAGRCKREANSGDCFEYFNFLRKFTVDMQGFSEGECGEFLASQNEIMTVFRHAMIIFTEIAWSNKKPEPGSSPNRAWLETSDLTTFCGVKDTWIRHLGRESLDEFRNQFLPTLPIEPRTYEVAKREVPPEQLENLSLEEQEKYEAKCTNCETIKKAGSEMSVQEIFSFSIFNINCDLVR